MKRKPARLSDSLSHRLNSYALAASAAGVSLLAFTQTAQAKVIYTKAHKRVGLDRAVLLDLNHDGSNDFTIRQNHTCSTSRCLAWANVLSVYPAASNLIWGGATSLGRWKYASALSSGVRIGGKGKLYTGNAAMAWISYIGSHIIRRRGAWVNVKDRYLGLEFQAKDGLHFGWARLNVRCGKDQRQATGILTGYAYETIPNKPIIAGKTKGPDVITVQPGTLGQLAHGAAAIPTWRTKQ